MSFWASSSSFQLESVDGVTLVQRGPVRVKLNDDCKDTRSDVSQVCYSRLNLFDAMLGRVQTR
jgi:hypothetical protein